MPVIFNPAPEGRWACAHRALATRRVTSCYPSLLRRPGRCHVFPWTASSSPVPLFSYALLLPLLPSASQRADDLHCGHRLPHASPTCQEALPRSPLPPQRATWCLKPLDAANTAVPLVSRRGSSSSIRELQSVPDLALALVGLAMSLRTEPLSPLCRFLSLTAGSVDHRSPALSRGHRRVSRSPALSSGDADVALA